MEFEDSYSIDDDTVCTICQAEFLDIDDLQLHVKQYHLNNSNLSRYCPFCIEILPDLKSLALHMRNKHLSSTQCCIYCTRIFIDPKIFTKHEKKHRHSELYPKISCSHCVNIFNNKNELENHEFKEHRYCDDSVMLQHIFPILSSVLNINIRLFLQSTHNNLLLVCIICKMSTSDVTAYIQHVLKENKCGYACDVCYNVYDTKTKISKHCAKHECFFPIRNVILQQCDRCKKTFTATNLTKHLKKCMDMQCNLCSMSFNSITDYSMHMASHSNEKTVPLHICKYCQRPLVGADTLEKHIERQHSHEIHLYKYHCKYCDKIFKHPKRLFGHFFTQHKDLQPYICKICNKSFRIRRNFTLHIKLDHKSVGFVEFDGQFHVYFTDKRSQKSKENNVSENSEIVNNVEVLKQVEKETHEMEIEVTVEETMDLSSSIMTSEVKTRNFSTEENENVDDQVMRESMEYVDNIDKQVMNKNIDNMMNVDNQVTNDSMNKEDNKINSLQLVAGTQANESDSKEDIESTQAKQSKRKSETDYESEITSDNSDMPLLKINKLKTTKDRKKKRKIKRTRQSKSSTKNIFFCKKCNCKCYTYQNYHRHLALHMKNERKICVKCHGNFRSENELKRHIQNEHSSSKLTETLKKVLERKKNLENIDKSSDSNQLETETERKLSISDRFKKTIKKVTIDKIDASVTITAIENDKLSAKKFIENFMPENQETNSRITISSSLSIKPVQCDKITSFIKLTKFAPEPQINDRPKLRMPVRFKDEKTDEYNVSIKVVDKPFKSGFRLPATEVADTVDSCYEVQEVEAPSSNTIPEIGREVMLDGVMEIPTPNQRTIVIKDSLPTDNIRIGHLWPQAPFFKIVKIYDVVKDTPNVEEPVREKSPNITLPNGTKLVNVNPLSHLLGNRTIHEVNKAKSKYSYYKPKVRNFGEALVKALTGLEKTPNVRKKANILRKNIKSK